MQELSEDKDSRFDCVTKFPGYNTTESHFPIKQQWNLTLLSLASSANVKNASRNYSVHAAGDW